MENTPPSGNDIAIPNIIMVREATDQSNHEDNENRNQVTGTSNPEGLQEQEDNQPQQPKEIHKISYWNGLYALVILGWCVASTCTVTIIPVHDILEYPEFWWESIFLGTVPVILLAATVPFAMCVYVVFGEEFFNSKLHPLLYFTASYLGWNICSFCIYIWWTEHIGYNFPMPGYIVYSGAIGIVSMYMAFWFGFAGELRSQEEVRTRLTSFIIFLAITLTIPYQQALLDHLFTALKHYEDENGIQVQWLIAFVIPISRAFYEWALPKSFETAAGHYNDAVTFYLDTSIGCCYALYVTVRLVHATDFVEYMMFGVEFFINLFNALQLIWMHYKVQGNMTTAEIAKWNNKKQTILRNLVTMETIDVLIPLAYSICYATAYYGPNAGIMRMVKATYFGHKVAF